MISLRQYYGLLSTYLAPYKKTFSLLGLGVTVTVAIQLISPQIVKFYIDTATTGGSLQIILQAAILYVLLIVIQHVIGVGTIYLSQNLSWNSTNNLRKNLFRHVLFLDMTFHTEYKPGELIERIDGDVLTLANFFSTLSVKLTLNILVILGVLGIMFTENLIYGFSFTLFFIFGITTLFVIRNYMVPFWKKARQERQELFGYLEERISGTEEIQINAGHAYILRDYHKYARKVYKSFFKATIISRLGSFVYVILQGAGMVIVFAVGAPLVSNKSITLGTLFMIGLYLQVMFVPMMDILRQIQILQEADASIERVSEILERKSKIINSGTQLISENRLGIEFNNVNFYYEEEEPVIKDFSINLPIGSSTGIIGRTGAGKSTLTNLIFRLYNINTGEINLFSDQKIYPIESLPLKELRSQISLVTQDVEIFDATLRNNLTFFDNSIPDEELIRVLREVKLMDWFNNLNDGLDEYINHESMSAGEAQLLAFSRVFLKETPIVIMDEASSRLDPATEASIEDAVMKLIDNKTAILIAHRLDTLDRMDNILLLDDGRIKEFGKRDDLLADENSEYSKLLKIGMEEVLG